MGFCKKCGRENKSCAKFCPGCGTLIKVEPKVEQSNEEPKMEFDFKKEIKASNEKNSHKKIHKCPGCGEIINPFEIKCSSCGYELRSDGNSLSTFKEMLEEIEIQKTYSLNDKNPLKMKMALDEQKISLINNFSVPLNKEDLYEFVNLARSNMYVRLGSSALDSEINLQNRLNNAWSVKCEQAINSAKTILSEEDYEKLFGKHEKDIAFNKKKRIAKIFLFVGIGIAAMIGIITFWVRMIELENEEEAAKRAQEAILNKGKIQIGCSDDSLKGQNYEDVVEILEAKGFTNIKVNDLNDLITGWISKDGSVENVVIGGDDSFAEEDWFAPDSVVVINYHSFAD